MISQHLIIRAYIAVKIFIIHILGFFEKPSLVMGRLYGRSGVIPSSRSNFAIAGVLYHASATSV